MTDYGLHSQSAWPRCSGPQTGIYPDTNDLPKPQVTLNQQGDRAMSRIATIFLTIPLAVSAPSAVAQDSTAREPAALAALDRMGSALAKKTEVNVHTDITAEDVLTTGQKLQYSGTID